MGGFGGKKFKAIGRHAHVDIIVAEDDGSVETERMSGTRNVGNFLSPCLEHSRHSINVC